MNLGQVQDPEAYTISQRESEEYDKSPSRILPLRGEGDE